MNPEWQEVGCAPAGGTILQMLGDPAETAWVASPAGLFQAVQGRWSAAQSGLPLAQVGALLRQRRFVLAAGLSGGAAYSLDGGHSWQLSRIEQTQAPLSCLVASPNFWQDGVLLAGTQGDGLLRSTDSGRSWQLANFGLRGFNIFSLAAAPAWGRKEIVFAGSDDGVYFSPNGGRAWKSWGLSQHAVLALALSPQFDQDQTLLAGAEDGLYRSTDAGQTWRPLDLGMSEAVTVNALLYSPTGQAWAGTSEHGVWRSDDQGASWRALENSPSAVLCLEQGGGRLYAGTFDQGLHFTADGGERWQVVSGLSARRFQWLAVLAEPRPSSQAGAAPAFLAGGALEGLWLVTGAGRDWLPLPALPDEEQLLCLALDPAGVWVGGSSGVWSAARLDQPFALSLGTGEAITHLACAGGWVWAGGLDGRLWRTGDGGRRWQALSAPGQGAQLLALAARTGPSGPELLAVLRDERRRLVQVWQAQSSTSQPDELEWGLRLSETSAWESVQLAYGGQGAGHWAVALGTIVYRLNPQGVERYTLPQAHQPLQALVWSPQAQTWLAAAGVGLWSSADLSAWQPVETGLPPAKVVAFQAGATAVAALTVDGRIWQWRQS